MRSKTTLLSLLLAACGPSLPVGLSVETFHRHRPDLAPFVSDMAIRSEDMTPETKTCRTSQTCVDPYYGQGRCVLSAGDGGSVGTCYAAVYYQTTGLMGYCSSFYPSGVPETCCLSSDVAGTEGSEVVGVGLDGLPCDLGAVAPWGDLRR